MDVDEEEENEIEEDDHIRAEIIEKQLVVVVHYFVDRNKWITNNVELLHYFTTTQWRKGNWIVDSLNYLP